mmetsp:Transcript_12820/g.20918  ORF Transcript_12820/g.20918 Transcript_12820/m.20918 type:complete len:244 (-) Transcript_12820:1236-1967(-)
MVIGDTEQIAHEFLDSCGVLSSTSDLIKLSVLAMRDRSLTLHIEVTLPRGACRALRAVGRTLKRTVDVSTLNQCSSWQLPQVVESLLSNGISQICNQVGGGRGDFIGNTHESLRVISQLGGGRDDHSHWVSNASSIITNVKKQLQSNVAHKISARNIFSREKAHDSRHAKCNSWVDGLDLARCLRGVHHSSTQTLCWERLIRSVPSFSSTLRFGLQLDDCLVQRSRTRFVKQLNTRGRGLLER